MSGVSIADFLAYWQHEGEIYARRGDYEWMAALVPGKRVLEIGCGIGFATQALLKRGLQVLAVDNLPDCLEATGQRAAHDDLQLLQADICALNDEQRQRIAAFAPDAVVCWLMGAPAERTGAAGSDGGTAVAAYREKVHRAVGEVAASLPGVQAVHLVDRTAIPWQAKDVGRDTLVQYHLGKTLHGLPFTATRGDALYRRLGDNVVNIGLARQKHPALRQVVPTLASLLAKRRK